MKNDFTVEAWVWIGKVKQSSYVISALGQDDATDWLGTDRRPRHAQAQERRREPGRPHFIVYQVEHFYFSLSNGESIEDRWLHVAVAFDRNNTAHLYLNGKHRGSVTNDQPARVGPVWLQIGCAELVDADFWRGRLAHVAVYPRALGTQQIQNHYGQRRTAERR